VTRPPPWWVPHVIGVLLWQAALWYGFWRLAADKPFADALLEATVRPAREMVGLLAPCTIVVVTFGCCIVFFAIKDRPRQRRMWWLVVYAIVAGYWWASVEFAATPLDL
jgi:hypothetical protein